MKKPHRFRDLNNIWYKDYDDFMQKAYKKENK